jgi:hypothetical protein
MKTRPLAMLAAAVACASLATPALAAGGLPIVSGSQSSMRWQTGARAHMVIDLHVANATSVSVQMTGYLYGSVPKPGLHLAERTRRFSLHHAHGDTWTATRRDNAAIGVAMADSSVVAVRACNASGCLNTDVYFHMAGE